MALHLPAIVTLLALLLFLYSCMAVAVARKKYGVAAPATTGAVEFEVVYRVQMNTLEQLALFVPGVIVGAPVLGDLVAGGLALLWSVGRIVFASAYYTDPAKRGPGFGLTLLPSLVLLLAGAWGAISALI